MKKRGSLVNKGVFSTTVGANKQIGRRFWRLGLELEGTAAKAFSGLWPGQFAELDLSYAALPPIEDIPEDLVDAANREILLRRPFSFCDVSVGGDKTSVEILYYAVGPASLRMTTLSVGESVSMIGPLGNGFGVPEDKKTALLVIGGMGAGPLLHLAKVLKANHPDIEVIAFTGAKTAKDMPFENVPEKIGKEKGPWIAEFGRHGIESVVATDDGSVGNKDFITSCLVQYLDKIDTGKDTIIYSCGPEAMLAKVAQTAKENNIDCQVSMERRMACGIGLCQSCAVECKTDEPGKTVYKLCCKDGPVFDSEEVIFNQ